MIVCFKTHRFSAIRLLLLIGFTTLVNASFAQFSDDFTDGDFTANPTWTGDTDNFIVNASGQLQLNDIGTVITQSALTASNTMANLNSKEWRLRVKQTFAGSESNQSRVYLVSNGDLIGYSAGSTANVQGYFLKFGEALSADVVRFFKDDGATITEIAACSTPISASFDIRLKIVRDNSGNWSIAIDPTAGENYVEEANFSETTYSSSSSFGIICTYTSSNATKFYFDDIYAGPLVVDTTPPQLLNATATSANTLDAQFNEALNATSAEDASLYNVAAIGAAQTATLDGSNPALVHLTFASNFNLNQTYTLTATNISDEFGNVMTASGTADFMWVNIGNANYHDVVFNEILADPTPTVALPDAEFVELYNNSTSTTFDLADWTFINTTTEKILPSFLLAPGQHVILCDEVNASLYQSFGDVIGIPSFSALSNTGDSLTLKNQNGEIIDIVVYSDSWFDTAIKLLGGWTLELINPMLPCQTSANWSESNNASGGTPGTTNSVFNLTPDTEAPVVQSFNAILPNSISIHFSETMDTTGFSTPSWNLIPFNSIASAIWNSSRDAVTLITSLPMSPPNTYQLTISGISDCSGNIITATTIDILTGYAPTIGDIVINEIMADPDPAIGMPNAEYIELRNNTSTLLDISSIKVNDGFFAGQVLLQPDSFIVIADILDATSFSDTLNLAFMESFPSLTNSGSELSLTNTDGVQFDLLEYSLDWYHDNSKIDGGWSLERINPLAVCSGQYNWKASTNVNGGTAGNENSIFSTIPNGSPQIVNYGFSNPTQIYLRFTESMDANSLASINTTFAPANSVSTPIWNTDHDELNFTIDNAVITEQVYTLDITGLTDCDGNQVNPTTLTFLLGVTPSAGDVIINEILADPSTTDQIASPSVDFLEIYNKSDHIIEMTHVTINDGFFEKQIIIYPDSFLIVTDADNSPALFFAYPGVAYMRDFPALTTTGVNIIMTGETGLLDQVNYTLEYYHDPSKEDGGYSMELINPLDPCSSTDNWRACLNSNGTSAGRRNSVNDLTADTQGPELTYILGEPSQYVTLVFNEPISETSLNDIVWTVDGVIQNSSNPTLTGEEFNEVLLFYGEMQQGRVYTFTVTGITDCWGNDAVSVTGKFGVTEIPEAGDLIINEILYNPKGDGDDFIEIYNNSEKIISLKNWKISDATGGELNTPDVISEIPLLFFPGEYLAISKETSLLPVIYPNAAIDRLWEIKGIPDFSAIDEVALYLPDGTISDHVVYDESLQYPLLNTTDGVSLERISFDRPSDDLTNWHSASETSGFATPGYLNSQSELAMGGGDVLTVESEIFSPDNDGFKDVATISYKLDEPGFTGNMDIYDSEGRFVRHLMRNELLGATGSISWDGLTDEKQKASIGIYVIMFEAFNPTGSTVKSKKSVVLAHPLN